MKVFWKDILFAIRCPLTLAVIKAVATVLGKAEALRKIRTAPR